MKLVVRSGRQGALVPYVGAALVPFAASSPKVVVKSPNGGFMLTLLSLALGLVSAATVAGVGELVLWLAGESWSVERVVRQQGRAETIFQRRLFDSSIPAYKLRAIQIRRPRILVVGSARASQWRAEMFGSQAAAFYNAAGVANSLGDLDSLVDNLPQKYAPSVLLLGLDYWWFNHQIPIHASDLTHDEAMAWSSHARVLARMLINPWSLTAPGSPHIGLQARTQLEGFRRDGSWEGTGNTEPPLPGAGGVRSGLLEFPECRVVSRERQQRLTLLLSELRKRSIFVVGYSQPFSAKVLQQLASDPGQKELWREFRAKMPHIFLQFGFVFVDGSDPGALGSNELHVIDHCTGNEWYHRRLLRRMRDDPRVEAVLPSPGSQG
jgi:hypothetical protein